MYILFYTNSATDLRGFATSTVGSGVAVPGTFGAAVESGATASSSATLYTIAGTLYDIKNLFSDSPTFSTFLKLTTPNEANGVGHFLIGFGLATSTINGSGIVFTAPHIGFKILKTGGAANLYATQGSGASSTASASLTTLVQSDLLELILRVNATSSVDYYWRKNGGTISSATNLTTNLPTSTASYLFAGASNVNTAYDFNFNIVNMSYER